MSIIQVEELNAVSLPFPSFQPNTIILSEQVNDNSEELQYKTNLLITSYNRHLQQAKQFEDTFDGHVATYNAFVIATNNNFVDVRTVAESNRATLDTKINTQIQRVDTLIAKNTSDIIKKADNLELRSAFLYLKSGDVDLSMVDLATLGGGEGGSGGGLLIDDNMVSPFRTWSSEKIKNYTDANVPKLPDGTPVEDAIMESRAVVDELVRQINGQTSDGINTLNDLLGKL